MQRINVLNKFVVLLERVYKSLGIIKDLRRSLIYGDQSAMWVKITDKVPDLQSDREQVKSAIRSALLEAIYFSSRALTMEHSTASYISIASTLSSLFVN